MGLLDANEVIMYNCVRVAEELIVVYGSNKRRRMEMEMEMERWRGEAR